jgi:hypothetical protein
VGSLPLSAGSETDFMLEGFCGLDEVQLAEGFVGLFSAKEHGDGRVCCALTKGAAAGEDKADGSGDHVDDGSWFCGEDGGEVCEFHGAPLCNEPIGCLGGWD